MKKCIYILFFFLSATVFGQNFKNQFHKEMTLMDNGSKKFENGEYKAALHYYTQALKLDTTEARTLFNIALCHYYLNEFKSSYNTFNKVNVQEKDGMNPYFSRYYYQALCLKRMKKYEEAFIVMRKFYKYNKDKKNPIHKHAKMQIKTIQKIVNKGIEKQDNTSTHRLNKNINTLESEFSPIKLNDTIIIYASYKHDSIESNNHVKPYIASIFDQRIENARPFNFLHDSILKEIKNIGNISFNTDTTQLYFSGLDTSDGSIAVFRCDGKWNSWSAPMKLPAPINLEGYNTTQLQPLLIDNKEMYLFASDRPKGKGGMDIWFTEIKRGKIKRPKNIKKVNSPKDEITPFYDAQYKTLYLSSDWNDNFGGFDIMKANATSLKKVASPKNIGEHINSEYNDLYYHKQDEETAYFSSNRLDSYTYSDTFPCCSDLYLIKTSIDSIASPKPIEHCPQQENLLADQTISLYFPNDYPNPRSLDTTTNSNYIASHLKYNSLFPSYIKAAKKKSKKGKQIIEEELKDFFRDYVDAGLEDLKDFTELILNQLNEGKDIEITVKGYASPLAKSDYNERLTKRRIQSFVNYIEEYKRGVFIKYLKNKAKNGAQMIVHRVPFGEEKADSSASDDLLDVQHSIYSVEAGLERKIEIISAKAIDRNPKVILYPDSLMHKYLVSDSIIIKSHDLTIKNGLNTKIRFNAFTQSFDSSVDKDICTCKSRIEVLQIPLELDACQEGQLKLKTLPKSKMQDADPIINMEYLSGNKKIQFNYSIQFHLQD